MKKYDVETFVHDLGETLAGLQVPLSLPGVLGTAREPLIRIRQGLNLRGWHNADEAAAALDALLAPTGAAS